MTDPRDSAGERWTRLRGRLLKDSTFLAVGKVNTQAFRLALLLLLAWLLGPADLGVVLLALATVELVAGLLNIGAEDALVKVGAGAREDGRTADLRGLTLTALLAVTAVGAVVTGLLVVAADGILGLLRSGALRDTLGVAGDSDLPDVFASMLRILALTAVIRAPVSVGIAVLQLDDRFDRYGMIKALQGPCRFGGPVVLMLVMGPNVTAVAWGYTAGAAALSVITAVLALPSLRRLAPASAGGAPGLGHLRAMGHYLVQSFLSTTLKSINQQAATLALGALAAAATVAHFRLAMAGVGLLGTFNGTVNRVIYARLATLWHRGDMALLRRLLGRASAWMTLATAAGALVLLLAAEPAVNRVLGPEYLPMLAPLAVLLVPRIVNNGLCWVRQASYAVGRPEVSTRGNLVGVLLLPAALVLLVPSGGGRPEWLPSGAAGAALAQGLVEVVVPVLMLGMIAGPLRRGPAPGEAAPHPATVEEAGDTAGDPEPDTP